MKRIHISEEQIRMLKKETSSDVLDNIMTQVANDETSLGHNPSLPNTEFQKEIISNGFKSAEKAIKKLFSVGDSIDTDKLQDIQSKLTKSLVEQETPIRDQLERIAQNAVIQMLRVPKNTVNMEFSLVDKVSPMANTRLLPEENLYTFRDAKDKQAADIEIQKRRMVDALIKGASRSIFGMKKLYKKELDKINKDLYPQYERLMAINDYLLYAVDKVVSDSNKGLKAYVGVRLGNNGKRTSVEAQATLFPYLIIESVRGFFEFFSTHGLPADIEQVKYILSNADYLLAEQWDERFGTGLWDIISDGITETGLYPYVFTDLCKLEPKEFNKTLSDAFQGNDERLEKIISKAEKNKEFNQFKDDIELKNLKNSILSDGDMNYDELVEHNIIKEQKMMLLEDQASKSRQKAVKYLISKGHPKEEAEYTVQRIKKLFQILATKRGGKFILGVTRLYNDHEISNGVHGNYLSICDALDMLTLEEFYEKTDQNLNGMHADEIIKLYRENIDRIEELEYNKLSTINFIRNEEYNIIPISSFEEMSKYSPYTTWCVCTSEGMYEFYTQNSRFYVLEKNGFQDITSEQDDEDDETPVNIKDEYGLSLIAVLIDNTTGYLRQSITRYNGTGKQLSVEEISELVGGNFYDIFEPDTSFDDEIDEIIDAAMYGGDIRKWLVHDFESKLLVHTTSKDKYIMISADGNIEGIFNACERSGDCFILEPSSGNASSIVVNSQGVVTMSPTGGLRSLWRNYAVMSRDFDCCICDIETGEIVIDGIVGSRKSISQLKDENGNLIAKHIVFLRFEDYLGNLFDLRNEKFLFTNDVKCSFICGTKNRNLFKVFEPTFIIGGRRNQNALNDKAYNYYDLSKQEFIFPFFVKSYIENNGRYILESSDGRFCVLRKDGVIWFSNVFYFNDELIYGVLGVRDVVITFDDFSEYCEIPLFVGEIKFGYVSPYGCVLSLSDGSSIFLNKVKNAYTIYDKRNNITKEGRLFVRWL